MVTRGCLDQLGVGFGGTQAFLMAVFAGVVEGNLGVDLAAVRADLADLGWIDRHHVSPDITQEGVGAVPGAGDHVWHMALGAGHVHRQVFGIVLIASFLEMAVLAACARGGLFCLLQLLYPGMRIVTGDTIQGVMSAEEHPAVLVLMHGHTRFGVYGLAGSGLVALSAHLGIAIDEHANASWIGCMQAAGSVARLALNPCFLPGAGNARQIALVSSGLVSGRMAGSTIVGLIRFAGMVLDPTGLFAYDWICQVELVEIAGVA